MDELIFTKSGAKAFLHVKEVKKFKSCKNNGRKLKIHGDSVLSGEVRASTTKEQHITKQLKLQEHSARTPKLL